MFIAHLPAGYLLGDWLHARIAPPALTRARFIGWSLLGAIAPDLDLIYFYAFDHRQTHHHRYVSHWPLLWVVVLLLSLLWRSRQPGRAAAACALVFALSGLGHQILDSLVGDIWWLAPFNDRPFALATVPATYHPWWLNFVLHWSFGFELAIAAWAVLVWRRRRNFPTC
ncbi:metal-dependent hydrolase [Niveibacterium sp. SC-1]|uniref:metal-dependent hydrolase n=1 Tax=Niveibacterium sp. SC-1 TaxID=3135646 RepID=UPI00311E7781